MSPGCENGRWMKRKNQTRPPYYIVRQRGDATLAFWGTVEHEDHVDDVFKRHHRGAWTTDDLDEAWEKAKEMGAWVVPEDILFGMDIAV